MRAYAKSPNVMRATPEQRALIVSLLRKHELPHVTVTVLHRDIFRRSGVPFSDGASLALTLDLLSFREASALIDELSGGDEESDDA